jgi:hypothetical protein
MNDDINDRVSQADLDLLMESAEKEEAILFGKTLVVSYRFPTLAGWTILGEGSVINPANFNIELGRESAVKKIRGNLWEFMAFIKQLEMAEQVTWTSHWKDR